MKNIIYFFCLLVVSSCSYGIHLEGTIISDRNIPLKGVNISEWHWSKEEVMQTDSMGKFHITGAKHGFGFPRLRITFRKEGFLDKEIKFSQTWISKPVIIILEQDSLANSDLKRKKR